MDDHNEENIVSSWMIPTANHRFKSFDESKERDWSGPYFFVQGADVQFGLQSRYILKDPIVNWTFEIEKAEEIVKQVNKMNPRPRFFVICGDLCDAMPDTDFEQRKKQEADFKRIFCKVNKDIPLVCVCGNHDIGDSPTVETVEKYHSAFGDDYFSFWCGGILYLVLNSQYFHDDTHVKQLAEQQSNWIEEQLAKVQEMQRKRVVVFQHIPWFLQSAAEPDTAYFTIRSELRRKWLDKLRRAGVEAVFCGHYHRNSFGVYEGMQMVTTSAIGAQLGQDASGARVVKVLEDKLEHAYYAIEDLPLTNLP